MPTQRKKVSPIGEAFFVGRLCRQTETLRGLYQYVGSLTRSVTILLRNREKGEETAVPTDNDAETPAARAQIRVNREQIIMSVSVHLAAS